MLIKLCKEMCTFHNYSFDSMENMLFLLQYLIKVDTFDLEFESSH